jgi:hypothetical protein
MVTVIFYTALHVIERYLACKGLHPADHTARDAYLRRVRGLKPIWLDYRRLKDESIRARYEVASFTADEVQGHQERLARIEAHVRLLLETAEKDRGLIIHEPRADYETEPPKPPGTSDETRAPNPKG